MNNTHSQHIAEAQAEELCYTPRHTDEVYNTFRYTAYAGAMLLPAGLLPPLLLGGLAVYVYGGVYSLIPVALGLIPWFYWLLGAAALPRKNRPMSKDVYGRSVRRLWRCSLGMLALGGAALITAVIFACTAQELKLRSWDLLHGPALVLLLLGAGGLLLLGSRLQDVIEEEAD